LSDGEKSSLEKWGSPWAENYEPYMLLAKAKTAIKVSELDIDDIWPYRHCRFNGVFLLLKDVSRPKFFTYLFSKK